MAHCWYDDDVRFPGVGVLSKQYKTISGSKVEAHTQIRGKHIFQIKNKKNQIKNQINIQKQ